MDRDLLQLSQERWRGDEPDAGLTWGVPMTGDAFVDVVRARVPLDSTSTILEIGPGYGRLLDACLAAGVPFGRYVGIDLSAARVDRLRARYRDSRIRFEQGDVLGALALNERADLVIASAVFEHLYPDFGPALRRIARFTARGAAIAVDFIRDEADADKAAAWFDRETYLRMYSAAEISALFEAAGFAVEHAGGISFGRDILDREITRTIVIGTRTGDAIDGPPPAPPSTGDTGAADRFEVLAVRDPGQWDHASSEPPAAPSFRTPFGGLWTDLSNAEAIAAGKAALGMLSAGEAALLDRWRRDGYVILPGAVDDEMVDAVLRDFERACDGGLDLMMSYWDEAGRHVEPAARNRVQQAEAKLLDLHAVSAAAQQAMFAPPIRRFLDLIFERPPLAFQSLGFYYGSQQPLHQDTAFVRVSSPMEFVASWIALEDIRPGSGELEYYPGSHALPHHLFDGRHLWARPGDPAVETFPRILHDAAARAGLTLQRFRPRRGDVLIWSAGLMHGGSAVADARLTRKSLVTHYCPADLQPMYAFKGGRQKRRLPSGAYVIAEDWT